jgi:S-adenosylmethionine:tRNA ribosyltransferase-isomerase
MRLADFDYDLPEELIAQRPVEPRDAARMLVLDRSGAALAHHHLSDLPDLLRAGDLLVANRSRVLPARVRGRLRGGGSAEFLLLKRLAAGHWEALARPGRRLRIGDVVVVDDQLNIVVTATHPEGIRHIEVDSDAALLAHGSVPLPPYIKNWLGDPERYQTIFGDIEGSAAAPTAGLHFTESLLERMTERNIGFASLVLHVGLDTFRPITHEDPTTHRMHREWYTVSEDVQHQIERTRADAGRVIAVGTTAVRALETWAASGESEGWTDLFILPGHRFAIVDALLTNFHLPRSTLLMLISAFAGRERVLDAYRAAIRERYRFYSFGDAMLIQ